MIQDIVQLHPTWTPDKQAERALFGTYWSTRGWKREPVISPDEFVVAKEAGYMFDPIVISHDEITNRLLQLKSQLSATAIAQGFSDSLTTRRLDLRSAFGSYGATLHLPRHSFAGSTHCNICKLYASREPEDLNVLSFERFKWGGVRHSSPLYALFDLSQFAAAYRVTGRETNQPLLRILDAAANAPANCRPNDLVKAIAPYLPGNNAERRIAIGALGYAGVLQPSSHNGFFDGYPIYREEPPDAKNDWPYPVSRWRGRDGVNETALKFYFPGLSA